MLKNNLKIGFAITGSFCTFQEVIPIIEVMIKNNYEVYPIISQFVDKSDTRLAKTSDFKQQLESITGKKVIASIIDAEPIGPQNFLDVLVIAPCTGNTLGKIANGITDTPVTMSCKAQLRNHKPVIIGISTNDGLGASAKNLGLLLNMKNIYFVPFGQDNPIQKPNSLVAKWDLVIPTICDAVTGSQIQPLLSFNQTNIPQKH